MANRHMKKCSTTGKCKSKPQMRCHLTPVKMAVIKKTANNKCWQECGDQGTPVNCWWECKLVLPLWKTPWRFLKKPKTELPYDPAIPFLDIPRRNENIDPHKILYRNIYSGVIHNSQKVETIPISIS